MADPQSQLVTDTLGRSLRNLRVSVMDRCNFRCPYCMPAEIFGERHAYLARDALLTFGEIARLTRIFVGLGARKLRLTGGEPLLRHDLPDLVAMLAQLDGIKDIALTTNGHLLPNLAPALRTAGIDRVTVSLDSLDDAVFRQMNGRDFPVASALAGIRAAEDAGLGPIKINCVVQRGVNDHTLVGLARRFKGSSHIVRFIEYMDVGTLNRWNLADVVPASEIVGMIDAELPLRAADPNYPGEVAVRYEYADGSGEIGVIASVTQPFCGDCARARLSTDGRLLTCLFASGGTDLRGPMRDGATDAALRDLIGAIWTGRTDRYSEERAGRLDKAGRPQSDPKVEMYQIGG